jgi:pimeloyl-ACP methyl ester carboxylesterase
VNIEKVKHEIQIEGADGKPITLDISMPKSRDATSLLIFCHGFKGFKDWGHFNWMADQMSENGLAVLKFNFSHNGVVPENLNEVTDLETFSMNNYSKELEDLQCVIDFVYENAEKYNIDLSNVALAGHSRGGGIALIKASEDKRISKLVLWASLSEFNSFFRSETIKEWNEKGVVYAMNKRTNQELPLKKQFYDDYLANKTRLDVKKAARLLDKPLLMIHGDEDETVPLSHAETLYQLVLHSIFIKVEGGGHTFSAKHPFDPSKDVNEMLEELIENTYEFIIDDDSEEED